MKNKIKAVLYNIAEYWDAQKHNFYFGMVLCALLILNIPNFIPITLGTVIAPVLSTIIYFFIWMFNCRNKFSKKYLLNCLGMAFLGSLLSMIFALL